MFVMVRQNKNQQGFITMIVLMIVVLALAVGFVYMRVMHAQK